MRQLDFEVTVKNAVLALCVLSVSVLAACDSVGDGTVASCATALGGSFDGDRQGPAVILIAPESDGGGSATASFRLVEGDNPDRSSELTVSPAGELTPRNASAAFQVSGTLDLDTCTASGDWRFLTIEGTDTGTWSAGPR